MLAGWTQKGLTWRRNPTPPPMEAVAPVIVTSQNRLDAAVSEAVKRGVREALAQLQSAEDERPGFGWVDNDAAMRMLNLSRPTLARYRAAGMLPYANWGARSTTGLATSRRCSKNAP